MSVLLQAGWDSNARFVAEPGPTSLATAAKLAVIHSRRFPKAVLSFSGQGGATYFTPEKGVNRFNASGRIGLNWRPSRASELALSQTVASALTLELPDLLASGLVLPRSAAISGTSNLEYTRQLGREWSVGAVGSFQWLHIPTAALVGGSDVAVRTSLGRRVGRHSTLTAVGSQRESRYADRSSGSRAASLGWSWRGDRGPRLQLEGGLAFPEQSDDRPLVGSAQVGWQGGALRAQAGYRRDVSQAFGIGRDRIAHVTDLNIGWSLSRRLTLSAVGARGISYDVRDQELELLRALSATGSLTLKATRRLGVGVEYGLFRSERPAAGVANTLETPRTLQTHRAAFTLSYAVDLR